MEPLAVYRAVERRLPLAGLAASFYVFGMTVVASMLSKTLLDGETSVLANPVIEFARNGVWRYPLHAQDIFFPGVKPFMIHPPLHYVMASGIVTAFGIGAWQLIAISAVVGIIGMGIVAYVSARTWGVATATVALAIATVLYGFYYSADQLRCDITFGFMYALFLLLLGRVLFLRLSRRQLRVHSFLIGLVAIATLAAHWYGYFVQLYVLGYLVGTLARGRDRLANVALVLAGAAVSFGLWSLLYGRDLWKALVFALVQGDQFRSTVHNTMSFFLSFATKWPGGRVLEIGVALALVLTFLRLGRIARRDGVAALRPRALPLGTAVEAYLLLNLAIYLLWFDVFVGNKAPQYGGDLYFFTIPVAARGYVGAFELIADQIRRPAVTSAVALVFAALLLATSTVVHDLFPLNPASLHDSNRVYEVVRSDLQGLIPSNERILMGVAAYPYLYDRPYVSPMRIVGSYFLKPDRNASFFTILRRALRQRKTFEPASEPPQWLASHLAANASYVVTNPDGEGWQYFFYDPRVWGPSYRQVAAVVVSDPELGRIQPDQLGGVAPVRFFAVYARRDRLAAYARIQTGMPDSVTVGAHVSVITFGRGGEAAAPVDPAAWAKLAPNRKLDEVHAYLDGHNWFGLPKQERAATDALFEPTVDAILSASQTALGFQRTLGQAVLEALVSTDAIQAWRA